MLIAASEPSKVPFYVAAGLLVLWAIVVTILGMRSERFPGGAGRVVLGISGLLVVATIVTSVLTAAKPVGAAEATPAAGSETGGGGEGGGGALTLAAAPSGDLKYDKTQLSASAGKVTIDFTNSSPVPHNVTIEKNGKPVAATKTIDHSKSSVSTTLKPGTYTFLCTVDDHAKAGMKGTLTVK